MIARKIIKPENVIEKYRSIIENTDTIRSLGVVRKVQGNTVYSVGPDVRLGEVCYIERIEDEYYIPAEVTGFEGNEVILSPLESVLGVYSGSRVVGTGQFPGLRLNDKIIGRVINGTGVPMDRGGKITEGEFRTLHAAPPNPVERPLIRERMETGVRAIDAMLTMGKGQRIGIFAGSGVGKSTLLGMIARYSKADVNVIALIGERGREVSEFIQKELGENGMKKSVVVVAAANESPMHRVRASFLATTIAEYFRDQGKNVMLMMDSLTRLAMAQREVGLSVGEPATTRGYPPSVFSMLPNLLERAGSAKKGSITGIYSVLVEGDDLNEPITDAVRGILDGHIVLSRKLAGSGHYPAIDIVSSISRLMPFVAGEGHMATANHIREMLSEYRDNEEIINLGAYVKGANPILDEAISSYPEIKSLLQQRMDEYSHWNDTIERLQNIAMRQRRGGNR